MYFIGIDHALRHTGVCLKSYYENTDPKFFNIETKERRGATRLKYIHNQLRKIVDNHAFIFGAIEGASYGTSSDTLYELGGVNGIAQITLFEKEIPFVEPAPNTLKKFLTGDGRASKSDMIEVAAEEISQDDLQQRVRDDKRADLADAYALAKMAKCIGNNEDIGGDEGDAVQSVLGNEKRIHTPKSLR